MSGDHNQYCSANQPDIVTRLRLKNSQLTDEAADEIERLRKIEAAASNLIDGFKQTYEELADALK